MHYSRRRQLLAMAFFGLFAGSIAIRIDAAMAGHNIHVRQEVSDGVGSGSSTGVTTTTGGPGGQSSTPSPSSTPTPSDSSTPSSIETSASTPPPTSSESSTAPSSSPSSTPAPSTSIEPLVSSQTVEYVTTMVVVSGSQTISIPVTTKSVNEVTTGFATHTNSPSLNGSNGGGSSGLSDNSKKIIGGVVGGVGGAILLAGIGFVLFRLRKKRQNQDDGDDDFLSGSTGSPLREKRNSHGGSTPFQSTLESYHNPAGKPNTAANF